VREADNHAMSDPDEITLLRVHPRPSESVALSIPIDTLGTIRQVAESRDMSPEALMRFYIGQGLRQDIARLASENDTRHPDSGAAEEALRPSLRLRGSA